MWKRTPPIIETPWEQETCQENAACSESKGACQRGRADIATVALKLSDVTQAVLRPFSQMPTLPPGVPTHASPARKKKSRAENVRPCQTSVLYALCVHKVCYPNRCLRCPLVSPPTTALVSLASLMSPPTPALPKSAPITNYNQKRHNIWIRTVCVCYRIPAPLAGGPDQNTSRIQQ